MLAIAITPPPSLAARIAELKRTRDEVPALLNQAVRTSAFNVVNEAKRLVPVSTGALRRSIQPYFFTDVGTRSFSAAIGSYLPYAARQEFDASLDHRPRLSKIRVINTVAGKVGSVIKGTGQFNPEATWGFLRKALAKEKSNFLRSILIIARRFA